MQRKVKGPHARKKKPQSTVHPGFLVTALVLIGVAMAWAWPNLSWPWDSVAAAQSTEATDELTMKLELKNLVTRVDELDERTAVIDYVENVTRMVETQAATMQNLSTLTEKIDRVAKIAQVEDLTTLVSKMDAEETKMKDLTERVNAQLQDLTARLSTLEEKKDQVTDLTERVNAQLQDPMARLSTLEEKKDQVTDLTSRVKTLEGNNVQLEDLTTLGTKVDAEETKLKGLTTRVTTLEKARQVAFTAMINDEENKFNKFGETVVFSNVKTNVGNNYNKATGIFTAPIKGLYFFTLTYHTHGGSIDLCVYKNKEWMSRMRNTDNKYHGSETNSLVMQLEKEDTVYVAVYAEHTLHDYQCCHHQSIFSGYLIHPIVN
ncbi:uncharacterized protein LOC129171377 isoform X2 [Dunckerocampus dactyliophorus]|nr:uncharacterized protein LOC129171377 isoform X2 [Dunckerocampus dactyliophorus]